MNHYKLFGINADSYIDGKKIINYKQEQSMTNEQKIKKLEKRIECEQQLINNCVERQENLQAEIEELKKPKYELYSGNINGGCYCFKQSKYVRFELLRQRDYYQNQAEIFNALANFAAHNDPTEKDRAWDGESHHWFIAYSANTKNLDVLLSQTFRCLTIVYFSTEELAEAALQMLKTEKLI